MNLNKGFLGHLVPILMFFIAVSIYFGPLYSGKILVQSDNVQLTGVMKEVADYRDKGEEIGWNPREFSGVPLQSSSRYNVLKHLNSVFFYSIVPKPIAMMCFLFLGMYILLQVFGVSKWLSAVGGFAYAFSTFNIISIEVGHDNKVLAMAFMASTLAGVILAYRGDLLKGGVLTMISAGFQLYYGHIQITYYLLMMVLAYLVVVLYRTWREKSWPSFFKASGVLALATLVAFGCNFTKLAATLEYADYSTRGGSELTKQDGKEVSKDGLDKDYALSWSNGIMETFTVLFPYFHGGASGESLDQDSDFYKAMVSRGVDRNTANNIIGGVPLYWGDQPFTAGPIYFGAIVVFLFVLGLLLLESPLRWWALGLVLLSFLLAMGKNLEWFTDIFFYNVPLYNKFRSVTMIMSIAELIVPLVAVIGLHKLIGQAQDVSRHQKLVLQVAGGIIGVGLLFMLFKGSFFDFQGVNDKAYGLPDWLLSSLVEQRKSLFNADIWRSVILVALIAAGIWFYLKGIVKLPHVLIGLTLLVIIDLWAVNRRYLGRDDFSSPRKMQQMSFQPSATDQRIQKEEGYFRVLNLASRNPFSDGVTSYHHYSVLGYSAIKMQRYQELIDKYIQGMDPGVLDMLNVRYVIGKTQQGEQAQRNADAAGNAWLVGNVEQVASADEEYASLAGLAVRERAVVDQRFGMDGATYAAEGSISLKSYHPEKMVYDFESKDNEFAVFSEIYYAPGWNAYIDGKKAPYVRVNYVLRGMEIPKGSHEIEFRYEPVSRVVGKWVSILCGVLLVVCVFLVAYFSVNLSERLKERE